MFDGKDVLSLDGDHLDISFRAEDTWPAMTPAGSIKYYAFGIGDPQSGPVVQLGLVTTLAEEPLDWRHVIDPPHFHGSDQFRVLAGGEWSVAGKPLHAGDFVFQEAGMVYREHPASDDPAWLVLVMGDRRGALPTFISDADRETVIDGGEYFQPADADAYAHPAGPKGIPAISTSDGECQRPGYLFRSLADLDEGAPFTGTWGDAEVGPSVEIVRAAPGQRIRPASVCGTEQLLVVTAGSATIGSDEYARGDMRVQGSDEPMAAIVAGSHGCQLTIVVADRRHQPLAAEMV
jgi:hypothetical protein